MYYVVYGLLYGISLLPMRLLYWLSDGICFLLYHVVRYRRDVVSSNLQIAFPDKTAAERTRIARQFYKDFIDSFIETVKLLSASPAFMKERFVIDNPELFDEFYKQGRKCQLHMGHTFNWEVANVAMPLLVGYAFIVAYMPVENKVFERLMLHLRGRTGTILLPSTKLQRAILPYRNTQYLLALVADQAPVNPSQSYWLNFFDRPTSFLKGPERGARIGDIPALFAQVYKSRRGYYRSKVTVLSPHPAALPEGELTRRYCHLLEDAIRQNPSLWLWSHRRWKTPWIPDRAGIWVGEGAPPPFE